MVIGLILGIFLSFIGYKTYQFYNKSKIKITISGGPKTPIIDPDSTHETEPAESAEPAEPVDELAPDDKSGTSNSPSEQKSEPKQESNPEQNKIGEIQKDQ